MMRVFAAVLALALAPVLAGAAPRLELDAEVSWTAESPDFGGFSALTVLDGGAGFIALSDRGTWARGAMERDGGRLTGVRLTETGPLRAISGEPLQGDNADAEDMAIDAEGRIWVSFEGFHRVRRYDRIDGPAVDVEPHPDFRGLQRNSALEALAIDAEGAVYAIPERSGELERPYPVYRLRAGIWDDMLALTRTGRFLVTGADFGPDGDLYVLERDLSWLGGFSTRVRRFALAPEGFDEGEMLLETASGELDNMEGISVWQDAEGRVRVTLLSDDNFFPLQSTIFAEYVLIED
jgi:hypothetical protein